jgi:hypothetical protein
MWMMVNAGVLQPNQIKKAMTAWPGKVLMQRFSFRQLLQ